MKRLALILASFVMSTTLAKASPNDLMQAALGNGSITAERPVKSASVNRKKSRGYSKNYSNSYVSRVYARGSYSAGPKPSRWCGWWMRTQFGGGPEYNLARNWAKRGRPAGGPGIGVVVVWRGHVGIITGKAANGQWIVKSGNDSNRVRERARSLKHRTGNPIAYRIV